jgi:hypothetical protein
MIWFDARQTRIMTAGISVLAVAVTPFVALSQPEFEPVARDDQQRQIVEVLQRIQSENGPNSPDSIDLWKALGLLYQESGDRALSAAAVERALQIVRVNYGVHSLDQAPLIQQLIRSEEENGNHAGAWEREQELLTLVRRHPDDMRTVPILRAIAAKRLDILDRYLAGERPPQIALGCYYDWSRSDDVGSCHSGSRRDVVRTLIFDAQRNFADAVAVILRNELYSNAELRELELELVRSSDLIRYHNDLDPGDPEFHLAVPPHVMRSTEPWRSTVDALLLLADWDLPDSPDAPVVERGWLSGRETEVFPTYDRVGNHYRLGRLALQRLFDYDAATSAPIPSQLDAVVAIADWDLLYSRNALAFEGYALAYRLLEETANARASIDRIFSPATPVMLPTFSPNPLVVDETRESTGYIDFTFEITKYGQARRLEIVDATANATDADKDSAVWLIVRTRFRPRVTDAEAVLARPVVARYYLYE